MTLSPIGAFGWSVLRLVAKVSCQLARSACQPTVIVAGTDGDKHSATLSMGQPGVLHGVRTYILQSSSGQINETHSLSAGLDYPGVGPEHAWLKDSGRAKYVVATDEEALRGFRLCTQLEGIIPGTASLLSHIQFIYSCRYKSSRICPRSLGSCSSGKNLTTRPRHRSGKSLSLFSVVRTFHIFIFSVSVRTR